MKQIKLPSYPTIDLPDNLEIRDYESDGKFYRVIIEIDSVVKVEHFHMACQVYDMDADGHFKTAPYGFPSRTNSSVHTVHKDDLGDTVEMDDDWCRFTGTVDMMNNPIPVVTERPSEPGIEYGQKVWDATRNHAWVWTKGFADQIAESKIQQMDKILQTSLIRSGQAFKRKRNQS